MTNNNNPLLQDWEPPYELPPFDRVKPEHFEDAFAAAIKEHVAEVAVIAEADAVATFDNTVAALERCGKRLSGIASLFFNLASADTNAALQAIEQKIAPKLATHQNQIYLNADLYARIDDLYARRKALDLTPEQDRVLERYHTRFARAGAMLDQAGKARMSEIATQLAGLSTTFTQNVLADESAYQLVLESEEELAGLPDFLRKAAAAAASEAGLEGKHVVTFSRSSIEPFLTFSERRDLREQAYRAWLARGAAGGKTDNRALIAEIAALRAERAKLLGFDTFAHYKLDDAMAKTPQAVRELLESVWQPARARALEECAELQAMAREEGANFELAPWDWRHYQEKVRASRHDLDESEIKPYFQLERMIEAAFDTAGKLFGLRFKERADLPRYHPDVRVWEVFDRTGEPMALFLGDYFTRPTKRGGAWMSAYRSQQRLDGHVRPVIVNVMNFVKAGDGEPTLLSFDDARTLFHEFGHALHGLLSDVTYPLIAGTSVAGDFVELPSQLYEHWLARPEILERFAVHAETGKSIPRDLMERLIAARNFNQGFSSIEYLASAIIDMDLHERALGGQDLDIDAIERESLARVGMPDEIAPRHRPGHFLHLFSGDSYAAGYYSYLWSEVMDADAFGAFEEAGDVFDPETASKLHDFVYSAGGRQDPADAYTAFRGRLPGIKALLKKRGLAGPA